MRHEAAELIVEQGVQLGRAEEGCGLPVEFAEIERRDVGEGQEPGDVGLVAEVGGDPDGFVDVADGVAFVEDGVEVVADDTEAGVGVAAVKAVVVPFAAAQGGFAILGQHAEGKVGEPFGNIHPGAGGGDVVRVGGDGA